jgi:peptidoglycan/LPS O-acetylase OafA/YrhL
VKIAVAQLGARMQAVQAEKTPSPKLQSIEGLRGLLALLVCVGHLGLNTVAGHVGLYVRFGLAVDLFFVLSGFVLALNYYFHQRTFRSLLVGRIARLYPLHALTLLMTVCVFWVAAKPIDWNALWQHAFLVHNIGLPPNRFDLNFPSWSISVEMALSLLFYVVAHRYARLMWPAFLVAGLVLGYLANYGCLGTPNFKGCMEPAENIWLVVNAGLLRGAAGFCIGIAAYIVVSRHGDELKRRGSWTLPALVGLVPFFLIEPWTPEIALLFGLVSFAFLIVTIPNEQRSVLRLAPFVLLGEISYSIYLLHIPISFAADEMLPAEVVRGVGKLGLMAFIIVVAIASYRYFEVPTRRLIIALAGSVPVLAADEGKKGRADAARDV